MDQSFWNIIFGIVIAAVAVMVIIIYIKGRHELTEEFIILSTTYDSPTSTATAVDNSDVDGAADASVVVDPEDIHGVEFPIALDTLKGWPVRTATDVFTFPDLGYYQVNASIPVRVGTSVGSSVRQVYIIRNGDNAKRYANSVIESAGSSFHTLSALIPCETAEDYIQVCYWCSVAGTTITGDPTDVNSCEIQIEYLDSL